MYPPEPSGLVSGVRRVDTSWTCITGRPGRGWTVSWDALHRSLRVVGQGRGSASGQY